MRAGRGFSTSRKLRNAENEPGAPLSLARFTGRGHRQRKKATRSFFSSAVSFKFQDEIEELDRVFEGQQPPVVKVWRAVLDAAHPAAPRKRHRLRPPYAIRGADTGESAERYGNVVRRCILRPALRFSGGKMPTAGTGY